MTRQTDGLGCPLKVWVTAAIVGLVVMLFLLIGASTWLTAIFIGVLATGLVGLVLAWLVCHPGERLRAAPASDPVDPVAHISGGDDTQAAPAAKAAPAEKATPAAKTAAPAPVAAATTTAAVTAGDGARPQALTGARDGGADDLKKIKGVGPKLELLLNELGVYHFDQIAGWTAAEVAWVDQNLKGFKGRVSRDGWVEQARLLAAGQETEFSRKVGKGGVY